MPYNKANCLTNGIYDHKHSVVNIQNKQLEGEMILCFSLRNFILNVNLCKTFSQTDMSRAAQPCRTEHHIPFLLNGHRYKAAGCVWSVRYAEPTR